MLIYTNISDILLLIILNSSLHPALDTVAVVAPPHQINNHQDLETISIYSTERKDTGGGLQEQCNGLRCCYEACLPILGNIIIVGAVQLDPGWGLLLTIMDPHFVAVFPPFPESSGVRPWPKYPSLGIRYQIKSQYFASLSSMDRFPAK